MTDATSSPLRLVIADDSALFREGVARVLEAVGIVTVGQAHDLESLYRAVGFERPDVVVVDIRMPPSWTDEGIRAAVAIRAEGSAAGVLVLSSYVETDFAQTLLREGATGVGYLLKDRVADVDELAEAIRRVARGGLVMDPSVVGQLIGRPRVRGPLDDLTAREREILAMMAEGRSNLAIGKRLFLSMRTVESHIRSIFTKLGLDETTDDNRRVLAVLAYLRG
jgi:DNA-binding NarL/FixJ family response regulator